MTWSSCQTGNKVFRHPFRYVQWHTSGGAQAPPPVTQETWQVSNSAEWLFWTYFTIKVSDVISLKILNSNDFSNRNMQLFKIIKIFWFSLFLFCQSQFCKIFDVITESWFDIRQLRLCKILDVKRCAILQKFYKSCDLTIFFLMIYIFVKFMILWTNCDC